MDLVADQKKYSLKPSIVVIIAIALFCIVFSDFWKNWKRDHTPFVWDVKQYYAYLPAAIIHHDLTFSYPNDIYMNVLPNGTKVPRATYAMSLMYLPSFLVGYKIAVNSKEPIDGFSEGFINSIHFGVFFYFILSLFILRSVLLRFFSENVVAFGLATVFFGTNLFFYIVSDGEMPHSYLFFLFSAFIWLTVKWHDHPKAKYSIFLGIVLALIALIRPTDIFVSIFFIFYGVKNKTDFINRVNLYKFHFGKVFLICLGFFVMILPQLIYWKTLTGQFLFFSYGSEEHFYFNDPKIVSVLFSYRKGWLLYTPVMIFALIGFFFSKSRIPQFNHLILIFTAVTIYLISSWWCWWFGGSFGMRAMVHSYSLLIFPLCCFIDAAFNGGWLKGMLSSAQKYLTLAIFILFMYFNMFQNYQYINGMLHYDSMTKKAYWIAFAKAELTGLDSKNYWETLRKPEYEKARLGIR